MRDRRTKHGFRQSHAGQPHGRADTVDPGQQVVDRVSGRQPAQQTRFPGIEEDQCHYQGHANVAVSRQLQAKLGQFIPTDVAKNKAGIELEYEYPPNDLKDHTDQHCDEAIPFTCHNLLLKLTVA